MCKGEGNIYVSGLIIVWTSFQVLLVAQEDVSWYSYSVRK